MIGKHLAKTMLITYKNKYIFIKAPSDHWLARGFVLSPPKKYPAFYKYALAFLFLGLKYDKIRLCQTGTGPDGD